MYRILRGLVLILIFGLHLAPMAAMAMPADEFQASRVDIQANPAIEHLRHVTKSVPCPLMPGDGSSMCLLFVGFDTDVAKNRLTVPIRKLILPDASVHEFDLQSPERPPRAHL